MAFRGRGRGRGGFGGGGGFRAAKQVPFELFPEIADFPDAKSVKEEMALAVWSSKLQTFWNSSPYYYEGVGEAAKNNKSSDKDSERSKPKPPLSHFIKMTDEYVPAELGERKEKHSRKKVRWNPESDQKKIDLFEKLEKKGQDDKVEKEKEKKEGEDEEEDDEAAEEEEEEFSDDGDYNQNIDFDDDEDDFNIDEGDDEAIF